jgi:AcrR family transcriptional regulator
MDAREQLLQATLKVYAEAGTRGATTRRIAHEAGVNEVTLFRQFGSKEALIREALGWRAERALTARLPSRPVDPARELRAFCHEHHRGLFESRSLVRKTLGEFEEHPEVCGTATRASVRVAGELQTYLTRLREAGLAGGDWHPAAAASMLLGALFADAMGRDCMPERYPYPEDEGVDHYVSLFLRAIGAHAVAPSTG